MIKIVLYCNQRVLMKRFFMAGKKDGLSKYLRKHGLEISVTLMSKVVGYSRNRLYYLYGNDIELLDELVEIAKEKIDSICVEFFK